ncbi:hypothetical protein BDD12DRAFT_809952 [Trichophaea hybrida]|nr:hypothetical protein BDD12DRAFT_809952 [Trichophaea hybrida]
MSSLTQKNSVAVSDDNTPSTHDPPVTGLAKLPRLWGRRPIDLCAHYAPPHQYDAPIYMASSLQEDPPSAQFQEQILNQNRERTTSLTGPRASTASSATRSRKTSTLTPTSFHSRSKTTQTDEEHDADERREVYERHQMNLSRRFPCKAVGSADLRKFHFRWRGMETGNYEVQYGWNGDNLGCLRLLDDDYARFEGEFDADIIESRIKFEGVKVGYTDRGVRVGGWDGPVNNAVSIKSSIDGRIAGSK